MQENVDGNILTKQYFPRAHTEARIELETGLIIARANSGHQFGAERDQQTTGVWNLLQKGPLNQTKRSATTRYLYVVCIYGVICLQFKFLNIISFCFAMKSLIILHTFGHNIK